MDGQNIFYHYTSINSLYNIIMSRELWLTNLKSSNDKSERYYICKSYAQRYGRNYK
ncbi:hypothetical protein [Megamonas funiformis]|uniref:hypothetical protein n=1 Tax=Megamonas funiformis TaxID=437897 RepID=UPI001F30B44E|nr:hypothetical protein [Megamonas funiformis]